MNRKTIAIAFASLLFLGINVSAQVPPPGGGVVCTNCPPPTNNFVAQPYMPGLKLSIQSFGGTNLSVNLLEADPAGTYDIFTASNLVGAAWNDILSGTNGQINFILSLPFAGMGFFCAARMDTPVVNTADMTVNFPNNYVNTNLISAIISGGPASALAVLVNDTNFADAIWIPFSAVPYVLLGTNDGIYQVEFGLIGSDGQTNWTSASVTLDTLPPMLVITNPTIRTTSKPMIQLQGYSTEPLSSIYFDVTNALGYLTNQQGFVTRQSFDTNKFDFTTNYFQCFDIPLTNGVNTITVRATDLAGNITTTNVAIILDFSGDTNPPAIQITWPADGTQIGGTNFTLDGQVDDETATISASIRDSAGNTNVVTGLVERNGKFWIEEIPLNLGTNVLTLTAVDAAGNMCVTNISLVQNATTLTMDNVTPDSQLWQTTINLTGKISDATYAVWVNGVKGTNNGDGTWSASSVPTTSGGTASFTMIGYAPNEQQPDGSYGN